MASILLPPAIAAKGFIDAAIPINVTATAALAGYGAAIVPAVTAITSAGTSIGIIQTTLLPSGAIQPPAKIGLNTTATILAQIATIQGTIVATIPQSVAVAGAPSPSFLASAALVGTQLATLSAAIFTTLITPQTI